MSLLFSLKGSGKKIPIELADAINSLVIKGKPYAAFDLDNTLLAGDIGDAVFALQVKKKFIKNFGWKDYQALIEKNKVKAYKHIIDEMKGLKLSLLEKTTREVINSKTPITLEGYKIPIPKPNTQMQLLLETLKEKGIAVYVITASNEVSASIICKKYFGIPESNVMGAEVARDNKGLIKVSTKELSYGQGKVNLLKRRFPDKPLVTGGDSPGDLYLLNYTEKNGIRLWLGNNHISNK
jgi:phosphoserine phosphatase